MGAGGGGGGGGAGGAGVGGVGSVSSTSGAGTVAIGNIDVSGLGGSSSGKFPGYVSTTRKAAASSSMPIRSLIEPLNSYIQATRGLT